MGCVCVCGGAAGIVGRRTVGVLAPSFAARHPGSPDPAPLTGDGLLQDVVAELGHVDALPVPGRRGRGVGPGGSQHKNWAMAGGAAPGHPGCRHSGLEAGTYVPAAYTLKLREGLGRGEWCCSRCRINAHSAGRPAGLARPMGGSPWLCVAPACPPAHYGEGLEKGRAGLLQQRA